MQELQDDNAELQSLNEDLVKELELRDVAVKEAVDLICELEAKVDAAELTLHSFNTSTRNPESSLSLLSSPPQPCAEGTSRSKSPPGVSNGDQPPTITHQEPTPLHPEYSLPPAIKSARRPPSFLREDKPSTSALRSLYRTETNGSYLSLNRAGSPQKDQDPDTFTLNSPRLSVLSESSFMSVYGKSPKMPLGPMSDLDIPRTRTPLDDKGANRTDLLFVKHDSSASRKGADVKAPKGASRRSLDHERGPRSDTSFLSRVEQNSNSQHSSQSNSHNERLSRWLDESASQDEGSPLRHRSHRSQSPKIRRSSPKPASTDNFSSIGEILHKPPPNGLETIPALPALAKPIFAGPEILPPTPDTMSTAQKANSSTQSVITAKSLNDISRPFRTVDPTNSDARLHTKSSLGLDFENDIDSSDEEQQSVHVRQSEADSSVVPTDAFDSFPFMGAGTSSKAMRMLGHPPGRPPLATNMIFDGDSYESAKASRALSYPSPRSDQRRSSIATTPTRPEPTRGTTTYSPLSPKGWLGNSLATSSRPQRASPSRTSTHAQRPSVTFDDNNNNDVKNFSAELQQTESKLPRTTSSRLKTLFRRSNSQSGQAVMMAMQQQQQQQQQNGAISNTTEAAAERESKIARPGTGVLGARCCEECKHEGFRWREEGVVNGCRRVRYSG